VALAGAFLAVLAAASRDLLMGTVSRYARAEPLLLGLGPEEEALVAAIRAQTTGEARILWEDLPPTDRTRHWTALLPVLTQDAGGGPRLFLGGLDPGATIEHAYAGFTGEALAGRAIGLWTDDELRDFCRRYNVGWIVCWSKAARSRISAWRDASPAATPHEEGPGCLFAVKRPHSFALLGKASWLEADSERVALADLVPEEGKVVLSLHYQEGMRASPARVRVERELDPYDPIPFVRLRVDQPVTRVTLTWEAR
jgi:hypothetical protein